MSHLLRRASIWRGSLSHSRCDTGSLFAAARTPADTGTRASPNYRSPSLQQLHLNPHPQQLRHPNPPQRQRPNPRQSPLPNLRQCLHRTRTQRTPSFLAKALSLATRWRKSWRVRASSWRPARPPRLSVASRSTTMAASYRTRAASCCRPPLSERTATAATASCASVPSRLRNTRRFPSAPCPSKECLGLSTKQAGRQSSPSAAS